MMSIRSLATKLLALVLLVLAISQQAHGQCVNSVLLGDEKILAVASLCRPLEASGPFRRRLVSARLFARV